MISAARHFGGAVKVDVGAAGEVRAHPGVVRWWSVNATGAGAFVTLPDAESEMAGARPGWGHLVVAAVGANDVEIRDADAAVVETVPAGWAAVVSLADRTGGGSWVAKLAELE
jgi:hypothetical protein